jgi:hypothetical protein
MGTLRARRRMGKIWSSGKKTWRPLVKSLDQTTALQIMQLQVLKNSRQWAMIHIHGRHWNICLYASSGHKTFELVCDHVIHRSEPNIVQTTQAPSYVGTIEGASHCFFRAIARIVMGSQDDHCLIIVITTKPIKENSDILSSTIKGSDGGMDSYLEKVCVEKSGVRVQRSNP